MSDRMPDSVSAHTLKASVLPNQIVDKIWFICIGLSFHFLTSSTIPREFRRELREGSFAQSEHKNGHVGCAAYGGSVGETFSQRKPARFIPMH